MADTYHLDYETYSPQPLGNQDSVGAFRYASDPEAEILIMAIAKNAGAPLTWDKMKGGDAALAMLKEAVETGSVIYAHNAQFEHAVSMYLFEKTFGYPPPTAEQWRCTAAMCRLAAIPSSLADAGEFLGISMPKDKIGKLLIDKFCKPRKATRKDPRSRIMPTDEPEAFHRFVEYCARDVIAEQQVESVLAPYFTLDGWALESFQADLRMNSRGIPVNRPALEHANTLMEEFLERMVPLFRQQTSVPSGSQWLPITGQRKERKLVPLDKGFNPTQREMMMVWLAERGFTGSDLTAETQEDWIANPRGLTGEAQIALYTYSLISSAAVKKIPAMLKMACEDGYIRGALMVFGAERTHRWTGRGVQPQNYARPRIKFTALAYDMICNGASLDEIESIFGSFFDVLVSVIRHFIQPHEGDCLQADYSAIEARVAPWLVGEEATLQLFRDGIPLYEIMATHIFGVALEDVTQEMRFVGKQAVLGCSYNMGRPKFRGTCESYGFTPSQEMVEEYRPRHAGVVTLAFSKYKAAKERDFARRGIDHAKLPSDHRLMELMIREKGWGGMELGSDGITPEELLSGDLNPRQWLHLTYDDLADRAVTAWREKNPIIVRSWKLLDDAAKEAILNPGTIKEVGKLKFCYKEVAGFKALLLKLPSGHCLVYPQARVSENKSRGWGTVIEFWGIIPNSGGRWGWCSTYGGKLLENATQAAAGDVMRHGMKCAETAGYDAFMLVHDEILTLITNPHQTHEELCDLLCQLASWMEGLPLAAEGGRLPFYKK